MEDLVNRLLFIVSGQIAFNYHSAYKMHIISISTHLRPFFARIDDVAHFASRSKTRHIYFIISEENEENGDMDDYAVYSVG